MQRPVALSLLLLSLILLSNPGTTRAEEGSASDTEAPPEASEAIESDSPPSEVAQEPLWNPPKPNARDFDWIRLDSGEWLKGDLKRLRNEDLEFDSDELDDLTFDWEDVYELISPRNHFYRFDDDTVLRGPAEIDQQTVRIYAADQTWELPRSRLIAIAPSANRELDRWTGSLGFGLTARSGNTDQVEANTTFWARRETAYSRLRFDYVANYGTVNNEETENNHRFTTKYDIYVTRDFYLTPLGLDLYSDPFTNIHLRLTPSAGLGYHVLRGRVEWSVEGGLGYQHTTFESVEAGESDTQDGGAVGLGTTIDIDVTKRIDFDNSLQIQLAFPRFGDSLLNLQSTIEVDLFKDFDLDVSFYWDRVQSPRPRQDGSIPDPDDFRLVVGLSYDF